MKIWAVSTPGTSKTLAGHANQVYGVAWSPDGKQIATGAADKTARQWDVAKTAQVRQINAHANVVYAVAFSPKGDLLVTGGDDKLVKYWNPADGKELRKSEGHGAPIYCLSFHPDGTKLASGSVDKTIRIWKVADGKELNKLDGHPDDVYSVAFSPDGKRLASVGYGGNLFVWDVAGAKPLWHQKVAPGRPWPTEWPGAPTASSSPWRRRTTRRTSFRCREAGSLDRAGGFPGVRIVCGSRAWPLIFPRVGGWDGTRGQPGVRYWLAGHEPDREDARPDREGVVFLVIDGRARPDLRRRFLDGQREHQGRVQLGLRGRPDLLPSASDQVVRECLEHAKLLLRALDRLRRPEDHRRSIVHGVVERRPGQDQAVDQRHRHADLDSLPHGLEHPARR